MNDKLIMENYLLILKSTNEVYVHGTLESSNQDVREVLHSGLNSTLGSQKDTYELMAEHGFYQINNVAQDAISKTLNKIKNQN